MGRIEHRGSWAPRLTDASPQPVGSDDATLVADDGCWVGCFAPCLVPHTRTPGSSTDRRTTSSPISPDRASILQSGGRSGRLAGAGVWSSGAKRAAAKARGFFAAVDAAMLFSRGAAPPIWNERQPQPNQPCWSRVLGVGGWLFVVWLSGRCCAGGRLLLGARLALE